jgi:hypothetical protein
MRPLRPPECIQTDRENEKDMSDDPSETSAAKFAVMHKRCRPQM